MLLCSGPTLKLRAAVQQQQTDAVNVWHYLTGWRIVETQANRNSTDLSLFLGPFDSAFGLFGLNVLPYPTIVNAWSLFKLPVDPVRGQYSRQGTDMNGYQPVTS